MPQGLEHLVDRQIRQWEEERRAAGRPVALPLGAAHLPMITISREYGARGAAVGKRVAERLNFHLFGRELVDYIAQEAHVQARVVEALDERVQIALEESLKQQLGSETLSTREYLYDLSRVVLALARHGRGVIIGRGAQFILDPAWTLRVRTIAPLEVRRARVGDPGRVDAERDEFCLRHFGRDPADVHAYDLILNTGSMSESACADVVVSAFHAKFT